MVALVAVFVAVRQVRESKRLRREQAQPYVAIYAEPSEVDRGFIDLVIRNFGTTIAKEVTIEIDPPPIQAAGNGPRELWIPGSIPALVPGQEWRTFWDYLRRREEADSTLPSVHKAKISFSDSQGDHYEIGYELDLQPLKQSGALVQYGVHHAAKALREMEKTLGRWKEGIGGGLAVTVRNGDAKDERRASDPTPEQWWPDYEATEPSDAEPNDDAPAGGGSAHT